MSANPRKIEVHPPPFFPYQYGPWIQELPRLAVQYRENRPMPHVHIAELLQPAITSRMAAEFPRADEGSWTRYRHYNENKLGMTDRKLFPTALREAVIALNSPFFVFLMSKLTGIPDLLPDPGLEGGGLHLCHRGGYLNLHSDFSMHHYNSGWRRRVNLILYLNREWNPDWGGAIEFWDSQATRCVVKYPPALNHAVVFSTDHPALHGFPDPVKCPPEVGRQSLALYYYTRVGSASKALPTNYHARASDRIGKKILVWLDKKAVSLYSQAKARFKFSDRVASRILGLFPRR